MTLNRILLILLTALSVQLFCHSEHQAPKVQSEMGLDAHGRPETWIQWLGNFHLIFVHFPIALIWLTAFSDLMYLWMKNPIYTALSRIALIGGALFSVPTAIFGLFLKFSSTFEGVEETLVLLHMIAGFATTFLAFFVIWIREKTGFSKVYGAAFILLLILVSLTGYLGGATSFGLEVMYFPKS